MYPHLSSEPVVTSGFVAEWKISVLGLQILEERPKVLNVKHTSMYVKHIFLILGDNFIH